MEISEIINEYFIKPIISPEIQGYNFVNTTIFIILLIIACLIIYKILKNKITFNNDFFIALTPYILFGVNLRVIMHQIEAGKLIIEGITKTANPLELGFWFFTPGVWILTFLMVIVGLLIEGIYKKNKKIKNFNKLLIFGLIITTPIVLFNLINFNNWIAFIGTSILIILTTILVTTTIHKFTKYKILEDKLNFFIILGQAIDGIASTIAISFFNFAEQHVVSNFVINIHPALFVLIKLILGILICYSLDDYGKENPKNQNLTKFIKIIIAILGLATGLASLIKLGII
ncbi:MAG: DUF63 family protein [Candidatus Diapherotrites archaeon]|uniref:DUF63 family protein n=1 Tax=Candidatus Iainarchaeum sp. TaxID=3101447 RepID=A0A7K4BZ44_9ARCH|nr:DUF63 family protein [Candidatus Diapherotrites archaeon]